jgi:hypothetical protein
VGEAPTFCGDSGLRAKHATGAANQNRQAVAAWIDPRRGRPLSASNRGPGQLPDVEARRQIRLSRFHERSVRRSPPSSPPPGRDDDRR